MTKYFVVKAHADTIFVKINGEIEFIDLNHILYCRYATLSNNPHVLRDIYFNLNKTSGRKT